MTGREKRPPVLMTPAAQESLSEDHLVESLKHTPAEAFGQRRQGRPLHLGYSVAAAVAGIAARGVL